MPDPLQSVPAGTNYKRAFLAAAGAVLKGGHIITEGLQAIQQIVEVLNLSNRPQAAHRHAYTLADDGGFANPYVSDAQLAVFFLQSCKALIDVTYFTEVFAKGKYSRV